MVHLTAPAEQQVAVMVAAAELAVDLDPMTPTVTRPAPEARLAAMEAVAAPEVVWGLMTPTETLLALAALQVAAMAAAAAPVVDWDPMTLTEIHLALGVRLVATAAVTTPMEAALAVVLVRHDSPVPCCALCSSISRRFR